MKLNKSELWCVLYSCVEVQENQKHQLMRIFSFFSHPLSSSFLYVDAMHRAFIIQILSQGSISCA